MSRTSSSGVFDPDIDSRQRSPVEPYWSIADCQRLIANPALALLVWLAAYVAIRHALYLHHLGWFLFGLVLGLVPLPLGRYHCLDCGDSGWALRAARHACPSVLVPRSSRRSMVAYSQIANAIQALDCPGPPGPVGLRDPGESATLNASSSTSLEGWKATSGVPSPQTAPSRFRARDVLLLAAWCGLAAGLLEVFNARLVPQHQPCQTAVPGQPALRLAGPVDLFGLLSRDGTFPRGGDANLATTRRLAQSTPAGRWSHPAIPHGGRSSDLP